jgi:hypothetical protein
MHHPFKTSEEGVLWVLENVKVPSGYSMNVSRFISFPDLKVAPSMKSYDYHALLT